MLSIFGFFPLLPSIDVRARKDLPEASFGTLVHHVSAAGEKSCSSESCAAKAPVGSYLLTPPRVLALGIVWTEENPKDAVVQVRRQTMGGWGVGRRGYFCDRLSACPFRSLFFPSFLLLLYGAPSIPASIPPPHRSRPGFVVVQYMLLLACLRTQSVVDGIDLEVDLADVFEYSSSGLHVVGCVALCASSSRQCLFVASVVPYVLRGLVLFHGKHYNAYFYNYEIRQVGAISCFSLSCSPVAVLFFL